MSYLIPIAMIILVLSPVLIPLVITGVHTFLDRRRTTKPTSMRGRAPVPA